MGKINIFWIEDNPLFGTDRQDPNRLSEFKKLLPDSDGFSFTLFQHPYEVREFLDMKSRLKEYFVQFSTVCPDNIPDIVVFDYKLSESFLPRNQNSFWYDNEQEKQILITMSGNLRFKKVFEEFKDKKLFIENTIDERIAINTSIANAIAVEPGSLANQNDEFGLFCGLSIIREFKDNITCGVPATINKPNASDLNINSAFFEWVNKYDLENALEKEDRTSKKFKDDILPFAIPLLRKRIIEQLSASKISIDLKNVLSLINVFSKDEDLKNLTAQYFIFDSPYGKRQLSLNALFFDKPETAAEQTPQDLAAILSGKTITEKDKAIWIFLNDVLDTLINTAKLGIGKSEIENAIDIAEKLIDKFDSPDFKRRILLSHYHNKVESSSTLTELEQKLYNDFKTAFEVDTNGEIKSKEFSLSTIGSTGKHKNQTLNKLAVFFVATNLWERYCNYKYSLKDNSTNSHTSEDLSHIALAPPDVNDLLLALFPIWTNNTILFNEEGSLQTKPVKETMGGRLNTLSGFDYTKINDDLGIDLRSLMTLGEYMIVKSFAASLNFQEKPLWLKTYTHG